MRIYIGLTLSECVCIMSGFGAYPQPFRSRPGGGPREVIALDRPIAEAQFDFETIHNFDAQTTENSFTIREAVRSYQMCIQYWMATVVYQKWPSKKLRTLVTFAVSAFWQGLYPGYFMSLLGIPLYLPVEAMWDNLMRQKAKGLKRQIIDGVFWVSKTFICSYLGMAFILMTTDKIVAYYQSVYYLGYVWGVGVFLVGLLVNIQSKPVKQSGRDKRSATPAAAAIPSTEPAQVSTDASAATPAIPATPAPEPEPQPEREKTPAPVEPTPERSPEPPAPEPPIPEPEPEPAKPKQD